MRDKVSVKVSKKDVSQDLMPWHSKIVTDLSAVSEVSHSAAKKNWFTISDSKLCLIKISKPKISFYIYFSDRFLPSLQWSVWMINGVLFKWSSEVRKQITQQSAHLGTFSSKWTQLKWAPSTTFLRWLLPILVQVSLQRRTNDTKITKYLNMCYQYAYTYKLK